MRIHQGVCGSNINDDEANRNIPQIKILDDIEDCPQVLLFYCTIVYQVVKVFFNIYLDL